MGPIAGAAWEVLHPTDRQGALRVLALDYAGFRLHGDTLTLRFLDASERPTRVAVNTGGSTPKIIAIRGRSRKGPTISLPTPLTDVSGEAVAGTVVGASHLLPTSNDAVVSFDFFWLGAVPTVDSTVCAVDLRDPSGTAVAQRIVPIAGPLSEEARDGVVETTFSGLAATPSEVAVSCRPWHGDGFVVADPPVIQREAPSPGMPAPYGDETAYVMGTATWSGEPSAQLWKCVGLAFGANGEVVMPETLMYVGLPPREGEPGEVPLLAVARIEGPIEDFSVDVTCGPTNELDPQLPEGF
jgi:hypothetical protein